MEGTGTATVRVSTELSGPRLSGWGSCRGIVVSEWTVYIAGMSMGILEAASLASSLRSLFRQPWPIRGPKFGSLISFGLTQENSAGIAGDKFSHECCGRRCPREEPTIMQKFLGVGGHSPNWASCVVTEFAVMVCRTT